METLTNCAIIKMGTRSPKYLTRHHSKCQANLQNRTKSTPSKSKFHMRDIIFDGNSRVDSICHHFKDIHSRNVHGLDLYENTTTKTTTKAGDRKTCFQLRSTYSLKQFTTHCPSNRPASVSLLSFKKQLKTHFFSIAYRQLAGILPAHTNRLRHMACYKFYIHTYIQNGSRSNLNTYGNQKSPYPTPYLSSYFIAIVMLARSFSICKIFTVKMYMTQTFTFRTDQVQM